MKTKIKKIAELFIKENIAEFKKRIHNIDEAEGLDMKFVILKKENKFAMCPLLTNAINLTKKQFSDYLEASKIKEVHAILFTQLLKLEEEGKNLPFLFIRVETKDYQKSVIFDIETDNLRPVDETDDLPQKNFLLYED